MQAFIANTPLRKSPQRISVSLSPRSPPRALVVQPIFPSRPRPHFFAVSSTRDEETFIQRHAAAKAKQQQEELEKQTENGKTAEEQFDYVSESPEDDASLSASQVDKLPGLQPPAPPPPEVVTSSTPPRVERSSNASANGATKEARVNILIPPGFRRLATRAQTDIAKFVVDTPPGAPMKMPTRADYVTAAWELTLIFALLMLLRAGVASTLRWVHNRLNATRGLKSNIAYEASVFECMQRPLEFLSLFTVGTAFAEAVSRPLAATGLLRHIITLRELGIIFAATWFLVRWIDRIRSRFAADKRIDKAQLDATARIVTVVTFIISLLISLDTIGINVQTVLAFGGIGGVAIGFAGREIISNFFGGFMIYITRPFSVGEWIRSIEEAELNGTVEDIGWYLTRVRTWDKRPLYIPNSRFSTLIVENGSRMDNRRVLHTLHLRHEDMPVIPEIVQEIEKYLMNHPELDVRQHRLVYVDSFSEFSVKIWLSCYTKSVFLYDFRRVQQDILLRCHSIIRELGAKLATINTRDVRPGIDTDRYGPYGNMATFGQSTPRSSVAPTPATSDVPGSPLYVDRGQQETLHTIESGVDLSRFPGQPSPTSVPDIYPPEVPNNFPTDVPISAPVGGGDENRKRRPLSNAAVAATAAAFLAARRNAMRRQETQSAVEANEVFSQGDAAQVGQPASNGPPPGGGGEMKISAAPPRTNKNPVQVDDGKTSAKAKSGTEEEESVVKISGSDIGKLATEELATIVDNLGTDTNVFAELSNEGLSKGVEGERESQIVGSMGRESAARLERSAEAEVSAETDEIGIIAQDLSEIRGDNESGTPMMKISKARSKSRDVKSEADRAGGDSNKPGSAPPTAAADDPAAN